MAITITHATVASDPQSPLLDESDWNANHNIVGLDKDAVGLGNVDNTSDANKPVSTAQQTALDLKANLAGAAFTGNVTAPAFIPNSSTIPTNGLYLPAANTLGVGINSARRMQINSAGAMDLGTGSVGGSAASLTINTNLNNTLILDSSASSVSIVLKSSSGANNFEFYTASSQFGVYNGANFQTPFAIGGGGTSTAIKTNVGATFGWTTDNFATNSADTGMSRVSAGVVAIGNGTQGNTSGSLTLTNLNATGTNAGITFAGITNEPSAPSAGQMRLYSKSIAGRMVPKIKGPSGIDTPLQVALWQNNITMWAPTTATAGFWFGTAGAGAGTYSTALPTTTSFYTAMKRARWANVVATTNQVLGQRNTEAMYFRGNASGQGGFFFYARCGFDVWTNGGRFFAGFATATTVVSAEPSALNNTVGFCVDSGDNGAISFLTRDTAATKQATGLTITSGKGYDVFIFAAPNSSSISYRIIDINTSTEYSNTASSTLPANTTLLTANVLASNAALTPVTSIQLGLNKIYIETDY